VLPVARAPSGGARRGLMPIKGLAAGRKRLHSAAPSGQGDDMYQRILVPVDGSPTSNRGVAEAIELARLTGGILRILHVIDQPVTSIGFEGFDGTAENILELVEQDGQRIVDKAVTTVRTADLQCDGVMSNSLQGRVCELVVEAARRWEADIIVVGTHGRRGVGRLMLGSDAEQILRLAPVPVLLVRAPASDRV
jgi:nucleotide-binding universal stress UspA family protein